MGLYRDPLRTRIGMPPQLKPTAENTVDLSQ